MYIVMMSVVRTEFGFYFVLTGDEVCRFCDTVIVRSIFVVIIVMMGAAIRKISLALMSGVATLMRKAICTDANCLAMMMMRGNNRRQQHDCR
jgi:preprotein translocase subunit SecF